MPQPSAPRRAVILGASNVYRNIATAVRVAQAAWGTPLELLIAAGHGRSYGMWNRVLGYSVPGIVHCGLWKALDEAEPLPIAALVTDVGNDLVYGVSPETILDWVETCLERLRAKNARIAMTELPLSAIEQLRPQHFVLLRSVLFPKSRLTFQEARAGAVQLNEGLQRLATKFDVHLVAPKKSWYGFDPIHVRSRHAPHAWHTFLSTWLDATTLEAVSGSTWQWYQLRRHRTHVQRFLGRQTLTPQPVLQYADGSSVSLF